MGEELDQVADVNHPLGSNGGVGDQLDVGFFDVLDDLKIVLADGLPRLDEVEDGIGESEDRREFDGTGERDDLCDEAAGSEMIAREAAKFGRDPEAWALEELFAGDAFGGRESDRAGAKGEGVGSIDVDVGFVESVGADDSDISDAVFDVNGDVAVFKEQEFETAFEDVLCMFGDVEDELAGVEH